MALRVWRLLLVLLASLVYAAPLHPDWLVFRDGQTMQTEGAWSTRDGNVVFRSIEGTLQSVRIEEVDLAASAFLTRQITNRHDGALLVTGPLPNDQAGPPAYRKMGFDGVCTPGTVVGIVDGDTLKVDVGGSIQTVRVAGIDTPETKHPTISVEYFGREATMKMTELADGRAVCLYDDPNQPRVDRYGRRLAYIALEDGGDLGAIMVAAGFATRYMGTQCSRCDYYSKLQASAISTNEGMWRSLPVWRPAPPHPLGDGVVLRGGVGSGLASPSSGKSGRMGLVRAADTRSTRERIWVDSYVRSDGTHVRGHWRSMPNDE